MIDILLNTNLDILITDNDVMIGNSDAQQEALLLLAAKGEFKEKPIATVGAMSYLEGKSSAAFWREQRLRFSQDGCRMSGTISTSS